MWRFIHWAGQVIDPAIVDYSSLHAWSVRRPDRFWEAVWEFCEIRGTVGSSRVVDHPERMPGAEWFPDSRLNFAENLLAGDPNQDALLFCGENGVRESITYADLNTKVSALSFWLRSVGVKSGDRVAGLMPNCTETVIAMLATASIGAIWSSCSPDFGVNGVIDRFGQIKPTVLFSCNGYYYGGKSFHLHDKLAETRSRLPDLEHLVIHPMLDDDETPAVENSQLFSDCIETGQTYAAGESAQFEQLPFDHPLYIMYSSGTTGVPKCIVHGAGGTLLQHKKELILHTDIAADDKLFYFTTCGWMMWNWLVSGLSTGATVVLYDGNPFYPDPHCLLDLIDELGITVFGTSAKYISALEKAGVDTTRTHSLETLRTILSTGSPLAPESFDYVYRAIRHDVALCSISGGTDIVSCFALGNPVLPVYRGQLQCAGLGMNVEILNDSNDVVFNETGELSCATVFPSMPLYFWNDEDGARYRNAYFSRVENRWCHGDYARLTPEGGLVIYGRSDATLNPGGVRIGTAEIYRQVEKLDEVIESIAVGQNWGDDVRVILFVRMRPDTVLDDELRQRIRLQIRSNTTPRHVPARIIPVDDIPRTISGKIVELAVRQMIHGEAVKNTDALANPEALDLYRNLAELETD